MTLYPRMAQYLETTSLMMVVMIWLKLDPAGAAACTLTVSGVMTDL